MSSLAERSELVGFFSYSREDDEDSKGALSALRDRIQRELRGQLGRSARDFRLWQDREAIAPGKLWESELKAAVAQSVFFIPIVTPTSVRSDYCRFEFEAFLAREQALGRDDLIFPLLYIRVPALESSSLREAEPVLAMIARRQYVDWREFRHRDVYSTPVSEAIERLCSKIAEALARPDPSDALRERRRQEEVEEQRRREAERLRREEEQRRVQEEAEQRQRAEAARERQEEAEQQRRREAERQRQEERRRQQEQAPAPQTGESDRTREKQEYSREHRMFSRRPAVVALSVAASLLALAFGLDGLMSGDALEVWAAVLALAPALACVLWSSAPPRR